MQQYKPFQKILGANFFVNNNFYDLFDLLENFKEKLEKLEKEIKKLNEQLKQTDIIPRNFNKRVKAKVELLRRRMQLQHYNNIFINKFLKKEKEIVEKEKQNIEKQEIQELVELQREVINKFKQLFLFFKNKEQEDKKLEEYLQNNL